MVECRKAALVTMITDAMKEKIRPDLDLVSIFVSSVR
jgi:phenylpyruvate tautomerase PptA (4-oxalocrotonate tautomerase family)